MDRLKKKNRLILVFAIIASIFFVLGIPGTVMCGVRHHMGPMIFSIIVLVFGFYGAPILWVVYAMNVSLLRTLTAIEVENIYTVTELANHRRLVKNMVKMQVTKLVNKMYLTGYIFDGETLTLNTNKKQKEKMYGVKCPSCGANVVVDSSKSGKCPYCGCYMDKK